MAIRYNDVKRLQADVDRLSPGIMRTAWNEAVPKFQLNGLVNINDSLEPDQKLFEYSVSTSQFYMGEASPRTCESDPTEVDSADTPDQAVMTSHHEVFYRVCIDKCGPDSLAEILAKKEKAAAMVIGRLLFNSFWFGAPELQQFGLLNHPLVKVTQSPASVDVPASTKWQDKTTNEIVAEIMILLDGMTNPRLVISQDAYRKTFGKVVGDGDRCTRLGGCIEAALLAEPTINYTAGSLAISKLLDAGQMSGGENAMIAYDADVLNMETSDYLWYGTTHEDKYVKVIRSINNTSLIVNQTNSVKMLRGI